jgi:alcohol dehydrogenase YqhD (iron-dependent ADH family)
MILLKKYMEVMMLDFSYLNSTLLVFGKDKHKEIGDLIKSYGNKVLLVYGGGSIKRTGLYDDVISSMNEAELEVFELSGVQANPILELVNKGIDICKKEKVDLVLAVGGGSVIDSAKAIAMGAYYEGSVWDFYAKKIKIEKVLPVATILTIPAAGSETSPDTVLTNGDRKLGRGDQLLRPVVSVINPSLFFTLPKNQIANGISDMMSHIFERYFTNTHNTDLMDALSEASLKVIMKNGLLVINDSKNFDLWSQIGLAGSFAHNGFLGMGRIEDWASHMMEHELSANNYDIAHGAGLAVITPAWMKYVYKDNLKMFVQFATNVMGVEYIRDEEAVILEGIRRLEDFYKKLGFPNNLKDLGLKDYNLQDLAAKCAGNRGYVGGFKKLYRDDIVNIYKSIE